MCNLHNCISIKSAFRIAKTNADILIILFLPARDGLVFR